MECGCRLFYVLQRNTEQSLLARYLDENLKFADEAVSAAIENSQSVVCPICQQLGVPIVIM